MGHLHHPTSVPDEDRTLSIDVTIKANNGIFQGFLNGEIPIHGKVTGAGKVTFSGKLVSGSDTLKVENGAGSSAPQAGS